MGVEDFQSFTAHIFVCERRVDLLVCSLPLHRHSYIGFILAFASSIHNKQTNIFIIHNILHNFITAPTHTHWHTFSSRFMDSRINKDDGHGWVLVYYLGIYLQVFQFPDQTSVCETCRFLTFQFLVFHHTDTHIQVLSLSLTFDS